MRRVNVVNRKQALKVVKELDAFPKVPESYSETSSTGGGVSIIVFILCTILIISEIRYYSNSELKFNYEVDTNYDGKLKINVDMTIAMKCDTIGADVLDMTGENVDLFGKLNEEAVHFELSPQQRSYADVMRHMNEYIQNEYHALHNLLWKSGYNSLPSHMPERFDSFILEKPMPKREDKPEGEPDGCRVYGTLEVNKVAGNFHVTAGKPIKNLGVHGHFTAMLDKTDYNFSHRITQFSFGDSTPGIVNPLDGEEKIVDNNYHMFQYFVQVVPTSVQTSRTKLLDTFQYAVTQRNRSINHSQGSHGVPGIFVKYDLSSLKISVREVYKPYWKFLVRLCGIVGGIFATSGMLHNAMGFLVDIVCCKYHLGKYSSSPSSHPSTMVSSQHIPVADLTSTPAEPLQGMDLLSDSINTDVQFQPVPAQ